MTNHLSEIEQLDSSSDTVLLDQSNFNTDIHEFIKQLVLDGVDPKKFKFRIVSWVASSPDYNTKRVRKREAISFLEVGKRTFERWLQIHFSQGADAVPNSPRRKRQKHQRTRDWEQRIKDIWKEGNQAGNTMTPSEVAREVERIACEKFNVDKYPSYTTVLRILRPLIEEKKTREGIYSAGQGSEGIVNTKCGKKIKASYPGKLAQADHTLMDVFSRFEDEEEVFYIKRVGAKDREIPPEPGVTRLWITVIKDVFSKCILGHLIGAKQPGSKEVALAIKRAICPKYFPSDYGLQDVDIPYGPIRILHTDSGSDLDSEHVKQIGEALEQIGPNLGFTHYLRARPEDGGWIESVFNGLNKRVLSLLPGYTGSNVTKRIKGAEKRAYLRARAIDKIISLYFYGEYNHECPKGMIRTRYQEWLHGLRGELPAIIDNRLLDICLRKVVSCKVYRHGTIRFKNQLYRAEILKVYEGKRVTMRYDSDNILRVLVFEQEADEKPGKFLGVANMLNVKKLNQLIKELQLDIRMINLKNLASEVFSLEELDEINQAASESRNAANASTKKARAKCRGQRRSVVKAETADAKKKTRKKLQKKQHSSLQSIAKDSTRPPTPNATTVSTTDQKSSDMGTTMTDITVEHQERQPSLENTKVNEFQSMHAAEDLSSSKVINLGEKIKERRLKFFAEKLKASSANKQ